MIYVCNDYCEIVCQDKCDRLLGMECYLELGDLCLIRIYVHESMNLILE